VRLLYALANETCRYENSTKTKDVFAEDKRIEISDIPPPSRQYARPAVPERMPFKESKNANRLEPEGEVEKHE
jgi:hypothetical protein